MSWKWDSTIYFLGPFLKLRSLKTSPVKLSCRVLIQKNSVRCQICQTSFKFCRKVLSQSSSCWVQVETHHLSIRSVRWEDSTSSGVSSALIQECYTCFYWYFWIITHFMIMSTFHHRSWVKHCSSETGRLSHSLSFLCRFIRNIQLTDEWTSSSDSLNTLCSLILLYFNSFLHCHNCTRVLCLY